MQACARILILVLVVSVGVGAQQPTLRNRKLTSTLDRMRSADAKIREAAFYDLYAFWSDGIDQSQYTGELGIPQQRDVLNKFFVRHPDESERVKLGLIRLLRTENNASKTAPIRSRSDGGEYGEYVFAVTEAVSALKDERAIPALVGAISHSGVDLLQYGEKALGPILAQRSNQGALVRTTSLRLAVRILRTKKNAVSRTREAALIRSSLKDPSPVVREAAAQEIVCLDNAHVFVPTLELIAKNDPASFGPGKADDGGDDNEFYPVRAEARRTLREIRSKKECSVCMACTPSGASAAVPTP
jgi:HEAT repeat protein